MAHPIQYFCSEFPQLEALLERFGSQLELLNREEKLQLRVTLTQFLWGKNNSDDYQLMDAFRDSIGLHLFGNFSLFDDEEANKQNIGKSIQILEGINTSQAESLLAALQEQCRYGNAYLPSPLESMTAELMKQGVEYCLAKQAAYILVVVDNQRDRSASEQETIAQVHKAIVRGGR